MVSRAWKVCSQIMQYLVNEGYTNQVHESEVEKAITYVRGPDQRTIINWKRALVSLGFLERIPSKVAMVRQRSIFQMNLLSTPDLLVDIVKRDDKQQKLM